MANDVYAMTKMQHKKVDIVLVLDLFHSTSLLHVGPTPMQCVWHSVLVTAIFVYILYTDTSKCSAAE